MLTDIDSINLKQPISSVKLAQITASSNDTHLFNWYAAAKPESVFINEDFNIIKKLLPLWNTIGLSILAYKC